MAFFATALLFWWPVIEPAPRLRRRSPSLRLVYVLLASLPAAVLGVRLSISPLLLYAAGGAATLEEQGRGGIVMWAGGGAVTMLAVLVLVWRFLAAEERRPPAAPQLVASG